MTNLEASQPVPAWPSFLRPILEVLSDGQGWKTGDLKPAAVARLQLSEMQRTQILKSGQSQADNRAGWALSALTRAKAVEKVQIGESRITDFGLQMLVDHPVEITEADVKAVPAYQEYVPTKSVPNSVTVDAEDLPSYWFVGAYFDEIVDQTDQTDRFLAEGLWINGNPDSYLDVVKAMKPGDRIALKATFTRKNELPFDPKGNRVSVMAIKATGTITRNHGDGYNIDVDWDPRQPVREWYFYTNQRTVWRVQEKDWKTKALIDFAFNGADQDCDLFRNTPFWADRYGDEAPRIVEEGEEETTEEETSATPVYRVADIVADGCFIPEETLLGYLDAVERKKNLILQGPPGTG